LHYLTGYVILELLDSPRSLREPQVPRQSLLRVEASSTPGEFNELIATKECFTSYAPNEITTAVISSGVLPFSYHVRQVCTTPCGGLGWESNWFRRFGRVYVILTCDSCGMQWTKEHNWQAKLDRVRRVTQ